MAVRMQKGFAQIVVAVIVLLLLGVGAYFVSTRGDSRKSAVERIEKALPLPEDPSVSGKEVETPNSGSYAGALLAGRAAPLLDFTKAEYENAKASDKLVALYFYANWCPICKVEIAEALYPAFNELSDSRVIGFRVNYNDSETEADEKALARELGIGYQHTKVFLKNGKRILKSPEGWSKERYLSEINKVLAQ